MSASNNIAVVTGASSGIGAELAQLLAARGYRVVVVARRTDRLDELCDRITKAGGVCATFQADLADRSERERLLSALAPNAADIEVLVNNAGLGTHGYFVDTDLTRELELIEVNCAALVHLTKQLLPWMLQRKRGYVMNLASVAAFQPGPLMANYYASKAFVLSFSEALSEEMRGTGIIVSALCPGTIPTEFQEKAGIAKSAPPAYATAMNALEAAQIGLDAMFAGKRVVITGTRNRVGIFLNRFVPRSVLLKTVRRLQEKRRSEVRGQRSEGSA